MSAITKAARRKTAAPQSVILKERPSLPRNEGSGLAKPTLQPSACVPSARYPPPNKRFVENKGQSTIQQYCRQNCRSPFSVIFTNPIHVIRIGLFDLVTLCRRIDRQWVAASGFAFF
jgi:hypothetical protein